MNSELCSLCQSPSPTFLSLTSSSSHPICLKCVKSQAVSDGELTFYTQKVREVGNTGELCLLCKQREAVEACSCVFPPPRLCALCRQVHTATPTDTMHEVFPLRKMQKITTEDDLTRLKHDLVHGSIAKESLQTNLFTLNFCQGQIYQRYQTLQEAITAYSDQQTSLLSHIKKSMQNELKASLTEAKAQIMDWDSPSLRPLARLLANDWDVQNLEVLELFRYKEMQRFIDLNELFGIHWESRITSSEDISPQFEQSHSIDLQDQDTDPLWYEDIESFLAAKQKSTCRSEVQLRIEYYQAHLACLQALEESFIEVVKAAAQGKKPDEGELQQRGRELLQSKVEGLVPDMYIRSLGKRIAEACETQAALYSAYDRHSELESILSCLSDPISYQHSLPPTRIKRGRGRPRSRIRLIPQKSRKCISSSSSSSEEQSSQSSSDPSNA